MKRYTLGFIFTSSFEQVLLIQKHNPLWQRGKLNGIGGKLERGETTLECMVRETKEESNLLFEEDIWKYAGKLISPEWRVDVFGAYYEGEKNKARSLEKEKVSWVYTENLPKNTLDHIKWLIFLTRDQLKSKNIQSFLITYG